MSGPDENGLMPTPDCVLDEVRFFDADTAEWGYAVSCLGEHDCGYWREMFRSRRELAAMDADQPEHRIFGAIARADER